MTPDSAFGSAIEVQQLELSVNSAHGQRKILVGVNLRIERGEILGLVGESGSGKSMTAKCIMGDVPNEATISGRILLHGEDVVSVTAKRLAELRLTKMALIFQDPRSFVDPLWRIEDYIGAGLRARGASKAQARETALSLLEQVEIKDPERVLRQYSWQVSGGMLQRVVIAGALAGEPELLIADEATTALDVTVQAEIVRILKNLSVRRGLSVLFITHDLALAAEISDRINVMYAGRIVEDQSGTDIFTRPRHPYTRALLMARPRLDERRHPGLYVVPGSPTSAWAAPAGCSFNDRCEFSRDDRGCTSVVPAMTASAGGSVACLRAEELGDFSDVEV